MITYAHFDEPLSRATFRSIRRADLFDEQIILQKLKFIAFAVVINVHRLCVSINFLLSLFK